MTEDEEEESAFPDGFIGEIGEGRLLMQFNRDSNGRITSFDVATDMVRPMRFSKNRSPRPKTMRVDRGEKFPTSIVPFFL